MQSPRKIAVAGATGRVGRHTVDVLKERGHDVVPMSRSQGVDVITRDGLAAALANVDCVIDAVAGPSPEQQAATTFFTTAAANLHQAGQRAGVQPHGRGVHHRGRPVYRRLRAREDLSRDGPPVRPDPGARAARRAVPRVGRATGGLGHPGRGGLRTKDAHPARRGQGRCRGPHRPGHRTGTGRGIVHRGRRPAEESLVAMARLLAARRGYPLEIGGVSDPADPDRELNENGALLPGLGAILTGPTFAEWLDTAS